MGIKMTEEEFRKGTLVSDNPNEETVMSGLEDVSLIYRPMVSRLMVRFFFEGYHQSIIFDMACLRASQRAGKAI